MWQDRLVVVTAVDFFSPLHHGRASNVEYDRQIIRTLLKMQTMLATSEGLARISLI